MQTAADIGQTTPTGGSALWRHVVAASVRRVAERVAAPPPPPLSSVRAPEKILANAIGRAAGRVHGMPLFFNRVECTQAELAELAELFPERPLISVVAGPAEAVGVVAICPGLLTSVIEMQAMGRVSARAAPMRRPTRADGAICADFINACLAELGDELASLPGCEGLRGYRYASFLDAPRPLELMLDEVTFHLLSIRLRAGDAGQRDGCIVIALPMAETRAVAPPVAETSAFSPDQTPSGGDAAAGALAEAVRSVPLELVGVLCRRSISLGELRALSPGDMIALPPDVLGAATIETGTGQILYRGKLGELTGRHALRLLLDGDRSVRSGDAASAPAPGFAAVPIPADPLHEPPISDLDGPDAFRSPSRAVEDAAGDVLSGGHTRDNDSPVPFAWPAGAASP